MVLRRAPSRGRPLPKKSCMLQETLIRKTRLLRKIGPMAMRSSVTSKIVLSRTILRRLATNDLEIASLQARAASVDASHDPGLGSISSSRCQKSRMPLHREVTHAKLCLLRGLWLALVARPASLFELRRGSLRSRPACRAEARGASEGWWSQTGSNRRPPACKAGALPAELWPRARSNSPSSPFGLRRATLRLHLAWLRHAQPKAKRGGPGKT
jgi:hypothetical protein